MSSCIKVGFIRTTNDDGSVKVIKKVQCISSTKQLLIVALNIRAARNDQ